MNTHIKNNILSTSIVKFENGAAEGNRQKSPLAQLVERETVNLEAAGSIPAW